MFCHVTKDSSITFVNLGWCDKFKVFESLSGQFFKVCFALFFIKDPGSCLKMNPQLESCFQF